VGRVRGDEHRVAVGPGTRDRLGRDDAVAAARLSTTTGWPQACDSGSASWRASRSVALPGPNDTMKRIGALG